MQWALSNPWRMVTVTLKHASRTCTSLPIPHHSLQSYKHPDLTRKLSQVFNIQYSMLVVMEPDEIPNSSQEMQVIWAITPTAVTLHLAQKPQTLL